MILMQNIRRAGINGGPILSRLWADVHDVLRRRRRPLLFPTHLPNYVYRVSFGRLKPLKLSLSGEVVEKSGLSTLDLYGEGLSLIHI